MSRLPELPGIAEQTRDTLEGFVREVVRWNRSINLVSRHDTNDMAIQLVRESVAAWLVLRERIAAGTLGPLGTDPWCYVDLGSGGGFPGLVWSLLFRREEWPGHPPRPLLLVEPRIKRVAFLERQLRLMRLQQVRVLPHAWGDIPRDGIEGVLPEMALVSMKALALDDEVVVRGWHRLAGDQGNLVVARFTRPGNDMHGDLVPIPVPGMDTALSFSFLNR